MKLFQRYELGCLAVVAVCVAAAQLQAPTFAASREAGARVAGPTGNGSAVLPVHQVITPAGIQVNLPGARPQALALNPAGTLLVTSGKTSELLAIDPGSGQILHHVHMPNEALSIQRSAPISPNILQPDTKGQLSYTGLIFSHDGSRIYLSNVNGSVKVFGVGSDRQVTGVGTLPLAGSGLATRPVEIPAGLALSPDDSRLYVALTLSNRLAEIDTHTGQTLRTFDVGAVPYDVALAGDRAYVSNWGGRRPDANSVTGPAGLGTRVRVDPVRYIASEGSVSIVDLRSDDAPVKEIPVGLHPSALVVSPDGSRVYVANAGSDSVSVIDTTSQAVVETIPVRYRQDDPYGACPDALAVSPDGKTLYVCNAGQNAVAVVSVTPGRSRVAGLIPTGWFPGAIALDRNRRQLDVANIKGVGSWKPPVDGKPQKQNSHDHYGTVSIIPVPTANLLAHQTRTVEEDDRRSTIRAAFLPARRNAPARPIPERVGEPSMFQHVVYIIKENRTYDQVLGDVKEGNGDPSLCMFGENVTPNQHRIARDFALLDNLNCCSVLSADGHQWTDSAFATDYLERSFCGWPRSYPDGMEDSDVDSLAYSPAGFLWDSVLAHGKTLRDYGEFTAGITGWRDAARNGRPGFRDFLKDVTDHTSLTSVRSRPEIESLAPYIDRDTIGWDLGVPDVLRAQRFKEQLARDEAAGAMPALNMICLPNDHTSGTGPGKPTPAAQVADNDLALGQIVEAISHSRFWPTTCVFVVEDDPQSGVDHVSAYRTESYVISPYTRRQAVVHTLYSQISIVRTIELILGLPPMNEMDAAATPMTDCFTDHPDLAPYTALPNNIPLDQMNPLLSSIRDPRRLRDAVASAHLPLSEPDLCPEDLLNRILWHAQRGYQVAYPGSVTDG